MFKDLSNVKASNTSNQFTPIYKFIDTEKRKSYSNVNKSIHINCIRDTLICETEIRLEKSQCLLF